MYGNDGDFYGEGISPKVGDPGHLFRIASQGRIGVFAAQLGLIACFGADCPEVRCLAALNSKAHLVKTA